MFNKNCFQEEMILKNPELIEKLKKASLALLKTTVGKVFAKNNEKIIKIYSFDDVNYGFIIVKDEQTLKVYFNHYSPFENRESLQDKVGMAHLSVQEVLQKDKLYFPVLIHFALPKHKDSNEVQSCEEISLTFSPMALVFFMQFCEKNNIAEALTENDLLSIYKNSTKFINSSNIPFSSLQSMMNIMLRSTQKNGITSEEMANSIDDNAVWTEDGCLMIKNQCSVFVYEPEDVNNFKIYHLNIEYSSTEENLQLWKEKKAISSLNHSYLFIEFVDGECTFCNGFGFNGMAITIEDSFIEMKHHDKLHFLPGEDDSNKINYEYLVKFYANFKNRDELELLYEIFYDGNRWRYSAEEKIFVNDYVFYNEEIAINTQPLIKEAQERMIPCWGDGSFNMTNGLSQQWFDGLKKIWNYQESRKHMLVDINNDYSREKAIKHHQKLKDFIDMHI